MKPYGYMKPYVSGGLGGEGGPRGLRSLQQPGMLPAVQHGSAGLLHISTASGGSSLGQLSLVFSPACVKLPHTSACVLCCSETSVSTAN